MIFKSNHEHIIMMNDFKSFDEAFDQANMTAASFVSFGHGQQRSTIILGKTKVSHFEMEALRNSSKSTSD